MTLTRDRTIALTREKALALTRETALALTREKALALTREKALALTREKALALTREKALALTREKAFPLTRERTGALTRERKAEQALRADLGLRRSFTNEAPSQRPSINHATPNHAAQAAQVQRWAEKQFIHYEVQLLIDSSDVQNA